MLKSHSTQLVCKSRTRVALIVIYTIIEGSFLEGNPSPTCWGLIQLCLVLRHPFLEHPEVWGHCQGRCTPLRPWRWLPVLVNFLASNPCRHESFTTRPSTFRNTGGQEGRTRKKATVSNGWAPFVHSTITQQFNSIFVLYHITSMECLKR